MRAGGTYTLFFFKNTATTEIYTLSLHDALPISHVASRPRLAAGTTPNTIGHLAGWILDPQRVKPGAKDRKSTRLNSSHSQISYAVFCLKKKKKHQSRIYGTMSGMTNTIHGLDQR